MSEAYQHFEAEPNDFQGIHDAVTLAFWGVEMAPCSPYRLPLNPEQAKEIHNSQVRDVSAYDAAQGCLVEIMQFQCDREDEGLVTPEDIVCLKWKNGRTITIDLNDNEIWCTDIDVKTGRPYTNDELKCQAKIGLAAIDSIFG